MSMNRRDFLKGAAIGALGLTTLGVSAIAEEKGIYTPGTYTATATGMGKITVTMTFDAKSITDVQIDILFLIFLSSKKRYREPFSASRYQLYHIHLYY